MPPSAQLGSKLLLILLALVFTLNNLFFPDLNLMPTFIHHHSPFVGALPVVSRASTTFAMNVSSTDIGVRTVPCSQDPIQQDRRHHQQDQAPTVNTDNKYFDNYCDEFGENYYQFLEQIQFFENSEKCGNFHGVKGSLSKHITFWENIGCSEFVLNTLKEGYIIPFVKTPPRMFSKNNRSASINDKFVDDAVAELVNTGAVKNIPFKPFVVSPLSVASNRSGKHRLILDLSMLNKYIRKDRFKFEDWKVAIQYFEKGNYLVKFDLKSGYHHIDVCPQQHTFLGFEWRGKYYTYTVLPFGLSTAPFIFSKCLREMVKYWRKNSIKIVLYLDDGLGMSSDLENCKYVSKFVRDSLISAGFLINEGKSIFTPVQELEWLGIIWNSKQYSLHIPERRLEDLYLSLKDVLKDIFCTTARKLAQCTGKIISLSPVVGNVTRLMTRHCYMCIEKRKTWDSVLSVEFPDQVIGELKFWLNNTGSLNCKKLDSYSKSSVAIFSDASNSAGGAYTVDIDKHIFHQMWSKVEMSKSSTWREMKAIEQALISYQNLLTGKSVKWFTDNQNCISIVRSGSMKIDLQTLASSIFSVCASKGISLNIQWVPRSQNVIADYISKMIDWEDWGVTKEFFDFLDQMWGPHTVDRFASKLNTKLTRYNSLFWNVGSEAIDAFTQNWAGENNWLVPPVYSVLRTLKHIIACKASGTLIVPRWVSAPFWPYIFQKDMVYQDHVIDVLEFKNTNGIFIQGSNKNSIFGSSRFTSPVLAVRIKA